jgi:toxin ParE1/3/4
MMGRIVRHESAESDIIEHAEYMGRDSRAAAYRFLEACEKSFQLLAQFPQLGAVWPAVDQQFDKVRFRTVIDFRNYVIIYLPLNEGVEIIRVLHAARDLQYLSEYL